MDIRVVDGFRNVTLVPTKRVTAVDDLIETAKKLVAMTSPEGRHLGRITIEVDRECRHEMDVQAIRGHWTWYTRKDGEDAHDTIDGVALIVTGDA